MTGPPVATDASAQTRAMPSTAQTPDAGPPSAQAARVQRLRPLRLRHLAWAEWRRHPWRQLAALLSVALGVALAFSVSLINESALAEFASATRAANGEPDVSVLGAGATAAVPEHWLDVLAAHPAVQTASPRIDTEAWVERPGAARLAVKVRGVDALSIWAVAPELLPQPSAAGTMASLDPGSVFVNATLAQALGPQAQQLGLVTAQGRRVFRIAGRVAAGGGPLVVLDIAAAQAFTPQPADGTVQLSRIDLRLAPGASREALLAELRLPPQLHAESPDDARQRVSNLSRAYRVNLTVLALVALVVGAFLVFSVMSLAVAQRTPALALLGVLGMTARQRLALVLAECAATGVAASLLGLLLGTGMAAAALGLLAGDLGGGYFGGQQPALRWSGAAALVFGTLGTLAAVAGGAWPALQAARLAPAQALKGLGPLEGGQPPAWPGLLLIGAGAGLALLPPVSGLPLGAYAAVAAWLVGGITLVPWAVRLLLGRRGPHPARHALLLLGLQRARRFRATATAAVAGVVASLALCVALTVMVASFREAVSQWLVAVLPADLYARATQPGADGPQQLTFPAAVAAGAAGLAGVERVQAGRSFTVSLAPTQPEVLIQARPLGERPEQRLPLVAPPVPLPPGEVGVFVSEAVVALHGVQPGQHLLLPLGRADAPPLRAYVQGVWRDYARQFGSIAIDLAAYQRHSGDAALNELALWLRPDAAPAQVQEQLRALVRDSGGDAQAMSLASTAQIKAISLAIFDRSFAVTRYLQLVAIAIGLAGVAASLSAQVLARRREFGLLLHLGLSRAQVLRLVMLETTGWLLAGVVVGVALGLAISVVLVKVVNPQSFHWTMDLMLPWPQIGALAAAVLAAGGLTSWLAARHAAGGDAVRAVKEDW